MRSHRRADPKRQMPFETGRPRGTAVGGIAVAPLALRRDNTEFRVYNVHLAFDEPGRTKAWNDTRSLIQFLEIDQQLPRWIPPIIVGDFNAEMDPRAEWLTRFRLARSAGA